MKGIRSADATIRWIMALVRYCRFAASRMAPAVTIFWPACRPFLTSSHWLEVKKGLQAGQKIVTAGAILLAANLQ